MGTERLDEEAPLADMGSESVVLSSGLLLEESGRCEGGESTSVEELDAKEFFDVGIFEKMSVRGLDGVALD